MLYELRIQILWPAKQSLLQRSKGSSRVRARPGACFDLDRVETELKAIEVEMSQPDFWNDTRKAKQVSKRASGLREQLETWRSFLQDVDELKSLAELTEKEDDEGLHEDIAAQMSMLEKRFAELEFAVLLSSEHDESNAIVSIHAGSGGTEAQDWTSMLYRMLTRFAATRDWDVEVIDESRAEDIGLKSITFRVEGRYAYGYLKSEAGVHRLVRISPFDAEKMRHTTFALVEVLPEFEALEDIEIDPKDLRIDTFMSGGHGGQSVNTTYSAVRIVHIPTGITVQCQNERSQQQNKEVAMRVLKARLHQRMEEERKREKTALRGDYQSAEWGNQIRSYVLHPYKLVKDHRTGYETQDAEAVLNGELTPFMEAYLRHELDAHRSGTL